MTRVDLITGFLGSGKTTFLKKYAKKLMEKGEKICIIENDFGAINVDMVLLRELLGDNCNIEMIVGGDGETAHQRRLKTKLIAMGMLGYDRVIIEPSGVFDPDELFDILYESPLDRWYEMGNVICIYDAENDTNLSQESRYMMMSEIASAGVVVVSKLNEEDVKRKDEILSRIESFMDEFDCSRVIRSEDIIMKNWDDLADSDYNKIISSGYKKADYPKRMHIGDSGYQTLFYFDFAMDKELLHETVMKIFANKKCGNVHRIKGFIRVSDNEMIELNVTGKRYDAKPVETDRAVLIIIGEALDRIELAEYVGEPSV